ncbi:MAG: hypothetical protein U1E65_07660 [Myxococcota bacterium]
MRSPSLVLAPLLALTTQTFGCASVLSGSFQALRVAINPPGARILVDGKDVPVEHGQILLRRGASYHVRVEHEGYEPSELELHAVANPALFANLLFGPAFAIAAGIDGLRGVHTKLDRDEIALNLSPLPIAETSVVAQARPAAIEAPAIPAAAVSMDPAERLIARLSPADRVRARAEARLAELDQKTARERVPELKEPAAPDTIPNLQPAEGMVMAPEPTPPPAPFNPAPSPSPLLAPAPHLVVAVMEARRMPGAVADVVADALTDQMRVFLAERRVQVIDRGAQEAALHRLVAEEKARSYSPCVDSTCQIPLGKALSASHILRWGMAKFGATCTTNGELVDLTSETTIAAGSARSDCTDERLLDATERLADQLLSAR